MKGWGTFFWLMLVFIGLGILVDSYQKWSSTAEQPVRVSGLFLRSTPPERASPANAIRLDQIEVKDASVTIRGITNPILAQLTDTNSMDPTFDNEATLLETTVLDVNGIEPGDIVSYITPLSDGIIVHRVIEVGEDDEGWYARFKGDNLNSADPQLVRANQIQRKVLAIFY